MNNRLSHFLPAENRLFDPILETGLIISQKIALKRYSYLVIP